MEEDIYNQDIAKTARDTNANVVIRSRGKQHFFSLKSLLEMDATEELKDKVTLRNLVGFVDECGEVNPKPIDGVRMILVARNIPKERALKIK